MTSLLYTSTNNIEYYITGDTVYHEYYDIVVTGDIDGDGHVTVSDKIMITDVIMSPNSFTEDQRNAADVDNSGTVTVSDKIDLTERIMNGQW